MKTPELKLLRFFSGAVSFHGFIYRTKDKVVSCFALTVGMVLYQVSFPLGHSEKYLVIMRGLIFADSFSLSWSDFLCYDNSPPPALNEILYHSRL